MMPVSLSIRETRNSALTVHIPCGSIRCLIRILGRWMQVVSGTSLLLS